MSYPSTLPNPEVAPVTAEERRRFSPGLGPRESRLAQRDRQAMQRVTWMLTAAQAAIFQAWWQNDLSYGAAWFTASWTAPSGGSHVRQFVGTPVWQQVGNEQDGDAVWRVNAVVTLRGAGALSG